MKLRVRADYTLLFAIVVVRVCIILAKINILINIDVLKYYIYFIRLLREKEKEHFSLANTALWSKLKVTSSANERDDIKWQIILSPPTWDPTELRFTGECCIIFRFFTVLCPKE